MKFKVRVSPFLTLAPKIISILIVTFLIAAYLSLKPILDIYIIAGVSFGVTII